MTLCILQMHLHWQRVLLGKLNRCWWWCRGKKNVTADARRVLGQVDLVVRKEEKNHGRNEHNIFSHHAGRFIEHNIRDETGDCAYCYSDVLMVLKLQ